MTSLPLFLDWSFRCTSQQIKTNSNTRKAATSSPIMMKTLSIIPRLVEDEDENKDDDEEEYGHIQSGLDG
jgi:hypothetical protein